MDIHVRNLGLYVHSVGFLGRRLQKLQVLKSITTEFKQRELCALMGASGCGKTTLLNYLANRMGNADYEITGDVEFRRATPKAGETPASASSTPVLSYVTQGDFLLPHLTVRETLLFAANMSLPQDISRDPAAINRRVEDTINTLGLSECADTVIGDEHVAGCSGGERRRVSIGVQLLTNPSVLLLDEPTTGLDAFTAANLVALLRDLARSGLTIIVALHQPRFDVFSMFDRVLLLAKGSVIYSGPRASMHQYFADAGVPCPSHVNPSDHFVDTAAVDVRTPTAEAASLARVVYLLKRWRKLHPPSGNSNDCDSYCASSATAAPITTSALVTLVGGDANEASPASALVKITPIEQGDIEMASLKSNHAETTTTQTAADATASKAAVDKSTNEQDHNVLSSPLSRTSATAMRSQPLVPFFTQLRWLAWRWGLAYSRDKEAIWGNIIQALINGLTLGIIYVNQGEGLENIRGRTAVCYSLCALYPYVVLVFQLYVQLRDLRVFDHERQSNFYSPLAYLLSREVFQIPFYALLSMCLSLLLHGMANMNATPETSRWIVVGACLLPVMASIALSTCSTAISRSFAVASLLSNLYFTITSLSSGFFVTKDNIPVFLTWGPYISPTYLSFVAVASAEFSDVKYNCPFTTEAECLPYTGNYVLSQLDLTPHTYVWPLMAALGLIVGLYTIGVLVLTFHRPSAGFSNVPITSIEDEEFFAALSGEEGKKGAGGGEGYARWLEEMTAAIDTLPENCKDLAPLVGQSVKSHHRAQLWERIHKPSSPQHPHPRYKLQDRHNEAPAFAAMASPNTAMTTTATKSATSVSSTATAAAATTTAAPGATENDAPPVLGRGGTVHDVYDLRISNIMLAEAGQQQHRVSVARHNDNNNSNNNNNNNNIASAGDVQTESHPIEGKEENEKNAGLGKRNKVPLDPIAVINTRSTTVVRKRGNGAMRPDLATVVRRVPVTVRVDNLSLGVPRTTGRLTQLRDTMNACFGTNAAADDAADVGDLDVEAEEKEHDKDDAPTNGPGDHEQERKSPNHNALANEPAGENDDNINDVELGMAGAKAASAQRRQPASKTPSTSHASASATSTSASTTADGNAAGGALDPLWLIRNVSFKLRPHQLWAVMGASGSGKSSLLALLSQRIDEIESYTRIGELTFNGQDASPSIAKKLVGLVTQTDHLLPSLSVRETLTFAALLRLPLPALRTQTRNQAAVMLRQLGRRIPREGEISIRQPTGTWDLSWEWVVTCSDDDLDKAIVASRVRAVIHELGLKDCADTLVGSATVRGISGGEKRRLSIGIQLITDPSVVLLDEPTSGLDSFTAYYVCHTLKGLARRGRTVLATLHQPRADIFTLFDNLLLLSKSHVVYCGPTANVIAHFMALPRSLVPACPGDCNPADWLLDVTSVDARTPEALTTSRMRVRKLAKIWLEGKVDKQCGPPGLSQNISQSGLVAETRVVGGPLAASTHGQRVSVEMKQDMTLPLASSSASGTVRIHLGLMTDSTHNETQGSEADKNAVKTIDAAGAATDASTTSLAARDIVIASATASATVQVSAPATASASAPATASAAASTAANVDEERIPVCAKCGQVYSLARLSLFCTGPAEITSVVRSQERTVDEKEDNEGGSDDNGEADEDDQDDEGDEDNDVESDADASMSEDSDGIPKKKKKKNSKRHALFQRSTTLANLQLVEANAVPSHLHFFILQAVPVDESSFVRVLEDGESAQPEVVQEEKQYERSRLQSEDFSAPRRQQQRTSQKTAATSATATASRVTVSAVSQGGSHLSSAPFSRAFPLLLQRSWTNIIRQPELVTARFGQIVSFACMICLFFAPLGSSQSAALDSIGALTFSASLLSVGMLNAVAIYPPERDVFNRERSDGVYGPLPFFLSYLTSEVVTVVVSCVMFTVLLGPACNLHLGDSFTRAAEFFLAAFCVLSFGESMGMIFTTIFLHVGFAVTVVSTVINIVQPMAGNMVREDTLWPPVRYINYANPMRYYVKISFTAALRGIKYYCSPEQITGGACTMPTGETMLSNLGIDPDEQNINLIVIAALAIFYRLLALLAIKLRKPMIVAGKA